MALDFKFLGECHLFALALHQTTRLPLCVLWGERVLTRDNKPCLEKVLIHVGVLYQGNFFDETGNQGIPEDLLQDIVSENNPYTQTLIFWFDAPNNHFFSLLKDSEAKVSEERIEYFKDWIKLNGELYPFLPS